MANQILEGVHLRARLLRRVTFRFWKSFVLSRAKPLIGKIEYESLENFPSNVPAIILSSFNNFSDFLILAYLFQDKELTFIATPRLPNEKTLNQIRSINHILYWYDKQSGYSFFRKVLSILRDFNRSIVIAPDATTRYANNLTIDPTLIVKLAMIANVPILPIIIRWQEESEHAGALRKCEVTIKRRIYISPKAEEFRDVFFQRRGTRKFKKLSREELSEIGRRIFLKITAPESN